MWNAALHFLQTSRVLIFSRGIDPARPHFGHARSIIEMLPKRMAARVTGPIPIRALTGGNRHSVSRTHDACKGLGRPGDVLSPGPRGDDQPEFAFREACGSSDRRSAV